MRKTGSNVPHQPTVPKMQELRKMRVFLSGPVTGREKNDYMEEFTTAQKALEEKKFDVVNPAAVMESLPDMTYQEVMQLCLQLLEHCDLLVQLPNWKSSCGANMEYGYAIARGIGIHSLQEMLQETAVDLIPNKIWRDC
jgi:nucleoside 2-deoxyribosyltransferase